MFRPTSVCPAIFILWLVAPSLIRAQCVGDCNGNGVVEIPELVTGISIALALSPLRSCAPFDADHNGSVRVTELVSAVNALIEGCAATPTASTTPATPTGTVTPTPVQLPYVLSGTINGEPAHGRMVLVPVRVTIPNRALYEVITFTLGPLTGTGELEFLTLNNTFTILLDLNTSEGEVRVTGTAPLLSETPLTPGDFVIFAPPLTIVFSATPKP